MGAPDCEVKEEAVLQFCYVGAGEKEEGPDAEDYWATADVDISKGPDHIQDVVKHVLEFAKQEFRTPFDYQVLVNIPCLNMEPDAIPTNLVDSVCTLVGALIKEMGSGGYELTVMVPDSKHDETNNRLADMCALLDNVTVRVNPE